LVKVYGKNTNAKTQIHHRILANMQKSNEPLKHANIEPTQTVRDQTRESNAF